MIFLTIVPEGKCAALTGGISAIGVYTTLTSLDPALVSNDKTPVIIHCTFGNIVLEIRFSHLVAGIELNSKVEGAAGNPGTVHPLTVNLRTVDIETSGR